MPENNYVKKVNVGIEPEHVVVTKGDDGTTHTSFVYSLENWATISMIGLVPSVVMMIVAPPIASAFLLLVYLFSFDGKHILRGVNIIGALAALYVLIDYHNGWFVSQLVGCFFSKEHQYWMLYCNLTMLILHAILYLFGASLVRLASFEKGIWMAYVLFLMLIIYQISKVIINHNVISFIIKVV